MDFHVTEQSIQTFSQISKQKFMISDISRPVQALFHTFLNQWQGSGAEGFGMFPKLIPANNMPTSVCEPVSIYG